MANPRVDIVDIASITRPFGTGGLAPAAPAAGITIDNEFEQQALIAFRARRAVFGETFIYLGSGGGERSIVGIVNRDPVEGLDSLPHGNAPVMMIEVENNAENGIASYEIDTGGDKARVEYRPGETPLDRRITKIGKMDRSSMTLEIK